MSHEKYIKDGKVFAHLRCQSKVFPRPLTDLSAWGGFCTSSPQQGVKYQLCQIWYLTPCCGLEMQKPTQALKSVKGQGHIFDWIRKYIKDGKVLDHLGCKSKVFPAPLTCLGAWVGFCTSSPQQGCGLEMQKPTQALKSVKGQGHIFDWIPKWARTLPSLIYFSWDFHRDRLHLKPTAGCQISTLIFDFLLWGWSLLISHEKYIKDGKVLAHLGIQSKIWPWPLTDLSAWVGFS
jgi:hypothetical protein